MDRRSIYVYTTSRGTDENRHYTVDSIAVFDPNGGIEANISVGERIREDASDDTVSQECVVEIVTRALRGRRELSPNADEVVDICYGEHFGPDTLALKVADIMQEA